MNLFEIAHLLHHASIINQYEDVTFSSVSSDSRRLEPQALFIAIRGERFDGHDYIQAAEQQGAAAVVCETAIAGVNIPQLVVSNVLTALADIARHHRESLSCNVIALTGSNGKTSVKEMIANILPNPSFATPGNLNNHIGAPMSVLQLKPDHRYAVFELGASQPGDIAHTVAVVKPVVSLINNIAPAHIAGFGTIDGVADAKGEIYRGLMPGGTAVVNDDDAYAHYWDAILKNHTIVRFSANHEACVQAKDITLNAQGQAQFKLVTPLGDEMIALKVPGRHSVSNALAAAGCAYAIGLSLEDITAGLQRFSGVPGRMMFKAGKNHAIIIDDTYNANLRSVLTAVDVLAHRKGTRILVLGDMGELGDWTKKHHQDIGVAAQKLGIDFVMTCGKFSVSTSEAFGVRGTHYDDQAELTRALTKYLNADTTILVKGSRLAGMEKVVHELMTDNQ